MSIDQIQSALEVPMDDKSLRRALKRLVKDGMLRRLRGKRYMIPTAGDGTVDGPKVGSRHLGTLRLVGKASYIEPESADRHTYPILVSQSPAKAEDRCLVEYEVVEARTSRAAARAEITDVIGRRGERPVEMWRLFEEYNLPRAFPDAVESEAERFGEDVPDAALANRKDLRDLEFVTIDGEDAKDFDDAIYVARQECGAHRVFVAIADVSYYVAEGSRLDQEAYKRSTSTYLTDRCIPMLPEALSNGLCSLRPNVDRLVMVADLLVNADGNTTKQSFYRAVINSKARLTYTMVAQALDGDVDEHIRPVLPVVLRAKAVAGHLLAMRLKRGALDLDVKEAWVKFEGGLPVDALPRPRNDAHRLIEDLMLAANEAVARFLDQRGKAGMFRIHEDPDPEKLAAFAALCSNLGLKTKFKKKPTPKDIAILIAKIAAQPETRTLQGLLLRCMAQARYSPTNEGHFGLAATHYTHFTSPIRRYPDLVVHRLMLRTLGVGGETMPPDTLQGIAEHTSTREREAMVAARSSVDLDRAYVAAPLLGEQRRGRIVGIARFGLFVALEEPFVEGMIPIHTIPRDYWEADENGAAMRGQTTGVVYRLGDQVEVQITRVDLDRRKIEMQLPGSDEEAEEDRPRRGRPRRLSQGRKRSEGRSGGRPGGRKRRGGPKRGESKGGESKGGESKGGESKRGGTKPSRSKAKKGRPGRKKGPRR